MKTERGVSGGGIFVIAGPGGVGKSTIVSRLKGLAGVFYSVSVTSRPPRPGEVDGIDYRFVSRDEFEKMIAAGGFAEYASVGGSLYGTPKGPLLTALAEGKTALVDIDVQGAAQIKQRFPSAVLVFIEPPGMKDLEERMRRRGAQDERVIRERLALAASEMECAAGFDFRVVNDDLDKAVSKVKSIMEV